MKSLHRFLFPLLALAAIALSLSGVALAREISEMEFFNSSAGEVEITGVVESYDGSTLVINGQSIVVPVTAEIKGEIVVGQVVKVHALVGANDTLTAREIEPVVSDVVGDDLDDDSSNINGDDDLDDDSANINGSDDLDDDLDDDTANINADDDLNDDFSDDNSANINANDNMDDDNSANFNAGHDSDDDDNSNSNTNSGQDNDDNSDDNNNTNTNSGHDDNHNDNSGSGDDDNDNSGHGGGDDD